MTTSGVSSSSSNASSSEATAISLHDCWEELMGCHQQLVEAELQPKASRPLKLSYTEYEVTNEGQAAYRSCLRCSLAPISLVVTLAQYS